MQIQSKQIHSSRLNEPQYWDNDNGSSYQKNVLEISRCPNSKAKNGRRHKEQ